MIKYICVLSLILVCNLHYLQAQNAKQKYVLEQIEKAFVSKNTDSIQSVLSEKISIAGQTHHGAIQYLNQIIQRYSIKNIGKVLSVDDKKRQIEVEFIKQDLSIDRSILQFDENDKLVYVDLFDRLYGMNRQQKSTLRARIPFENHHGSIVLTVQINDFKRPLRLLFDTGADGMAIRKSLADEIGLKVTRQNNASVVGGNMNIQVSDNNSIMLDTLVLGHQGIAIFPEMGKGEDGIIGNSILKRFITKVNYDRNEIELYDFGDYQYAEKGFIVPVTMPEGLVIIPGHLSIVEDIAHTGDFVFDTGASYSLICFRPFVRKNKLLVSGMETTHQGTTASMGMVSSTFSGNSYSFALSNLDPIPNLPVTLMAGSANNENWNPGFDGSIGVRLLSRYNFTVNLLRNEIFFSPNASHDYPHDFVLNNYLMGWNNKGKLQVLSVLKAGDANSGLQVGEEVIAIEGIASDKLLKAPKKLIDILHKTKGTTINLKMNGQSEVISLPI